MELSTRSFKENVLNSNGPVFVEFWASWCLPCKQIDPVLKNLASQYGIRSVPTTVIEENGNEVDRFVGALPKKMIMEKISIVVI